jgi:hypothetical protein
LDEIEDDNRDDDHLQADGIQNYDASILSNKEIGYRGPVCKFCNITFYPS